MYKPYAQVSWTKLVSGEIQQRCFHCPPAAFAASKVAMSKLDTAPLPYVTLEKRIKIVADRYAPECDQNYFPVFVNPVPKCPPFSLLLLFILTVRLYIAVLRCILIVD